MRKILLLLVLLFITNIAFKANIYAAAPPTTKEQLLKEFQDALHAKNEGILMELFYWGGVKEEMKSMTRDNTIKALLEVDIKNINFKPLSDNFPTEHVANGIRYRSNIPILGFIEVQHAPHNYSNAKSLPFGKKNNSFYFTNTIQEEAYEPTGNEVSLNVAIFGNAEYPNSDDFKGYCIYWQGGEEKKKEFSGNGNGSYSFWGDGIKYCEVRKTSGDFPIALMITEDGKQVYKSEMSNSYQTIVYEVE